MSPNPLSYNMSAAAATVARKKGSATLALPEVGNSWGDAALLAGLTVKVNGATSVVAERRNDLADAKLVLAERRNDLADAKLVYLRRLNEAKRLREEANGCNSKPTWPEANGAACLAERAAADAEAVVKEATEALKAAIAKLETARAKLRDYIFTVSEKRRGGRTALQRSSAPAPAPAPAAASEDEPAPAEAAAKAAAPVAAAEDAPAEADFTEVGPRGKPQKKSAAHTLLASWVTPKTLATEKKGGVVKVTFGGRVEHAKYTIRVVFYSNGACFNQIGPIIFPDGTVVKHWFKGNTNLLKVGKFVAHHLLNYHNPRE